MYIAKTFNNVPHPKEQKMSIVERIPGEEKQYSAQLTDGRLFIISGDHQEM